jgi:macrodomain Ter protein organizer (MatP/YcbG family)
MRHSVKYDHDIGVAIHARVLIARFGKRAREDAENHAKKLKKSGDKDGYEVWMKVAKHIKRIKSTLLRSNRYAIISIFI